MPNLVTLTDPASAAAEAFRTLRTNLQFAAFENPIRRVVISAPLPEESKSNAAANLAVALAQSGQRTILIDADLRRPAQHSLWGVPNEHGLTSLIVSGAAGGGLPLQVVKVENLALLTSGTLPPNPADLLASRRMDEVLEALAAQADYLIFDAPPVLAVTDTVLLASKTDGVLLVLKAGTTRRDHAQRAKETLERAKVRILGVALTNAPHESGVGDYYGAKK